MSTATAFLQINNFYTSTHTSRRYDIGATRKKSGLILTSTAKSARATPTNQPARAQDHDHVLHSNRAILTSAHADRCEQDYDLNEPSHTQTYTQARWRITGEYSFQDAWAHWLDTSAHGRGPKTAECHQLRRKQYAHDHAQHGLHTRVPVRAKSAAPNVGFDHPLLLEVPLIKI